MEGCLTRKSSVCATRRPGPTPPLLFFLQVAEKVKQGVKAAIEKGKELDKEHHVRLDSGTQTHERVGLDGWGLICAAGSFFL